MPELVALRNRMSEAQFDSAYAELIAVYGTSDIEMKAKRDQRLAQLFHQSSWTQEELAAKIGKSPQRIAQQLRFGRFLHFSTNVEKFSLRANNLTEGLFRKYWERTDDVGPKEYLRFRAVADLIQAETMLTKSHAPKGYPKRILERFADGKWHAIATIAGYLQTTEDDAEPSLDGMVKNGRGGCTAEVKAVGTTRHYRFYKHDEMVSFSKHELIDKLGPIIKELQDEGKASAARASPMRVAILANSLAKLLKEWTE